MANGKRNGNGNSENTVPFSNIFDFEDPMTGEKYTKRKEPIVSTRETRQGKSVDLVVPDQQNRGWMQGWEKARKRVATSPVSFHTDELEPMLKGIFNSADNLEQPFRDKEGDLFGGVGLSRKGPQYGLPLDVRMRTLLGDVKRGDDIVDCYVRGLETPTRRKTYSLQQPPGRSFGLGGETRDQKAEQNRMYESNKQMTDMFGKMIGQMQGGSGGSRQSGSTGGSSGSSGSSEYEMYGFSPASSDATKTSWQKLQEQGIKISHDKDAAIRQGGMYKDNGDEYWYTDPTTTASDVGLTGPNIKDNSMVGGGRKVYGYGSNWGTPSNK